MKNYFREGYIMYKKGYRILLEDFKIEVCEAMEEELCHI